MRDGDPTAPVLALDSVCFTYGHRRVLDGVSLAVAPGEIVALLGPNGAGKTTLIRTISGQAVPQSGAVRVAGLDPSVSAAARRRIGLVPQQIALYPALTCRENLRAFAALMGLGRRAAQVGAERVMGLIGLADRAGDRVAVLSGGMARRINIGAAILHEPAVLVLDEPTVGLDPHAKEAIHELLLLLRARGMAMLLATHDMDQARQLADRVAIITEGVIRVSGPPAQLIASAFAGAQEVTIQLAGEPGEAALAALRAVSLRPVRGTRLWAGVLAGGPDGLAMLDRNLRGHGAVPAEISVREPNLASVFFQTVGRDLAL